MWSPNICTDNACMFKTKYTATVQSDQDMCVLVYAKVSCKFNHSLANSADNKLTIFFLFFPEIGSGDNLHEMSNPIFWEKIALTLLNMTTPTFANSADPDQTTSDQDLQCLS